MKDMTKLEQKRFEKQNKDMLDTMRMLEAKISEINKRLSSYNPDENYIERICDIGAVRELRSELKSYERLVIAMTKPNNNNLNLAEELFGGVK
jgi:DNA repair exonuclease SbcCD ATPase subunit